MMWKRILPLKVVLVALLWSLAAPLHAQEPGPARPPFAEWLQGVRIEAKMRGIRDVTLDAALNGLEPIPRVIELDRRQPEFTMTFRQYLSRLVSADRIAKGKRKIAENRAILDQIAKKYGVQPRFLVSFWGLETDFGRLSEGYFPTIAALATLAHDGRRSTFFREELLSALEILDQGHITPARMKGSWAGAMGHFQFIPSTFKAYAVDWDGDGKRDIWSNFGDGLASAANFLSNVGWNGERTWGREVKLPKDFDYARIGPDTKMGLKDWNALGIRRMDGRALPDVEGMRASVILPAGHNGPAFLVYGNFRSILNWNRSDFYAVAVGHLADRLTGAGAFTTLGPDGRGLNFDEAKALQTLLEAEGFDTGGADGVIGPYTRAAIREFQASAGMVPDGYPSVELLKTLRGRTAR